MTSHERTDIVVIGGGVTGASVSYALARAGARVTCVERSFPGAGASGASCSVDISSRKTPKAFFDLSVAAAREHAALERELGAAPWRHRAITLEWGRTAHERAVVRERVRRLRGWGYPADLIDRRAAERLAPAVKFADDADDQIARYADQAWYDTAVLTQLLLWHAQRQGAQVLVGDAVDSVDVTGGRVHGVATGQGRRFATDIVVDCAGPGADAVARQAGAWLPLEKVPGLVALARAPAHAIALDVILMAPGLNVRPAGDGLLKLHSYQADALIQGDAPDHAAARGELRSRAGALLPELGAANLLRAHVGVRPIPRDGLPVVGPLDGVAGMYAVVTHSAAHLGPLLGRLLAGELAGTPSPLLNAFRPQRFDEHEEAVPAVQDESFHETQIALADHATHGAERSAQ
jgi:glycine/D-amino acid oxidase-like deaminating enzyme